MTSATDANPVPIQKETRLQYLLAAWVDEQLKMGDNLSDAAETVKGKIIKEGKAVEVIEELGHHLISENWRYINRKLRAQVLPGAKRRVDSAALMSEESMLEILWNVDGDYYRLGDMDASLCSKAEGFFSDLAERHGHTASFFKALKKKVGKDKTVRELFSHEELQGLWTECAE